MGQDWGRGCSHQRRASRSGGGRQSREGHSRAAGVKFLFLSSYAHLVLDPDSTRVSGGAELQVALLARELAARGYETTIAAGDIGQPDGQVFQGVKIRNGGKFQTGGLADSLSALPKVARILREERPDHVLVLGWTAWLFILWLLRPVFGFQLHFICGLDTEVNGGFRRDNPVRGGLFEFGMRHCDQRFAMTKLQERLFLEQGMPCALYRNLILPRANPARRKRLLIFSGSPDASRSSSRISFSIWSRRCLRRALR